MPKPYTDLDRVKEVMQRRSPKKGTEVPFRVIAEDMGKDVKTIYNWFLQGTGKRKIRMRV